MSTKRLSWMIFGLAICLTASSCRTCQKPQRIANDRASIKAAVLQKMQRVVIPELSFRPPDTIIDALDFFKQASRDFDKPEIPLEERGVSLILKLSPSPNAVKAAEGDDPFAGGGASSVHAPVIQPMNVRYINLYDALKLVCDVTGMKFEIHGAGFIMITPLDDENELLARTYQVFPTLEERLFQTSEDTSDETRRDRDWKPCFETTGVTWPHGSSITLQGANSWRLHVTNTRKNLALIERTLKDSGCIPQLIDIDMQVVAFRPEDIEKLQRADGVSKESLMALRTEGKAKPVATTQTLIQSGHEAIVKAVQEVIYPTEISNVWPNEEGTRASEVGFVEPCNFEMRQVGISLQVIPEIDPSGGTWIGLMLRPEWVTLNRWETFPVSMVGKRAHKTIPFRQPVFAVTSFDTRLTVEDGETVLLGCGGPANGEWIDYVFLTVRLVPVQQSLRTP